ncbi:hypothetical protein GQ43DRAFT_113852 [Delitschia confertaspora ATCC 74209]|uniref:Uncharacterized protein n=1 Tax=Delitschia confertaspora ATCC 74209 TaxID=1513339 RepID=A0A9P4JHH0_9PLEO|nr:hypothetical protein GQ43DRAFT_113852 [Delitschia confertaspora ATCC 74209]
MESIVSFTSFHDLTATIIRKFFRKLMSYREVRRYVLPIKTKMYNESRLKFFSGCASQWL